MSEMLQTIGVGVLLLAMIIAIPASIVLHVRQQRSATTKGKATAAVGNALQDLDRLMARPSIEYRIEAENYVQKADDDQAGD
jgi:hypothetical protein